jgi:HK97 family phage portal protein
MYVGRATGSSNTARSNSYAIPNRWDVEKSVNDAYERVNWVFRCVDAISSAQADIPIIVRRGDRDKGEIVEYPDIDRLLNYRANSYEVAWDFRYRLSGITLLSPRGAFIEMIPSMSGGTAELHLLAPGQTEPIPDPVKFVSGYKITRADGGVDEVPADRVMWIKAKPHPTDPYKQMTPIIAAGLSIETDFFARLFNRNFLANDGRPSLLVGIRGRLSQQDADEVKRRFSGGYVAAGQASVIEADQIQVEDLAARPRDMQWEELLRGDKEDILIAFGTPESVLGNASGRTFDNADAERENWYVDTVKGHCNSLTRGIDKLTKSINDKDIPTHDFTTVPVLQRHEEKKRADKQAEFAAGVSTLDEYLEAAGEEILDVPGSRVYFHPMGVVIAKNPEDAKAAAELPKYMLPPGMGAQQPGSPQIGSGGPTQGQFARAAALPAAEEVKEEPIIAPTDDVIDGEVISDVIEPVRINSNLMKRAKTLSKVPIPQIEVSLKDAKTHPYIGERSELEGFIEGSLTTWTERQEKVVLERTGHAKFRKDTRHWEDTETKYPKSQKCKDCSEPATKRVIHSDGRGYVPCCDAHLGAVKARVDEVVRVEEIKELKALNGSYVVEADEWADDITATLTRRIERVAKKEAREVVRDMKDNGITVDDSGVDQVVAEISALIRTAAKNQSQRIVDKIQKMDQNGEDIAAIKRELKKALSTRSGWHKQLATNVTTAVIEGVRDVIYSKGGPRVQKMWNAMHDERVRDSHWRADGQVRAAGKKFRVGKSWLRRPGDPAGAPEETINCRCYVTWTITN